MPDFVRKQGNLSDPIRATLTDQNGPVDLPVGATVLFISKVVGATTAKTRAAAVVVSPGAPIGDANRGAVRYDLHPTDVDTPGLYDVQWDVSAPTGPVPQSFPEGGYQTLLVLPGADAH
jgi:hypothetical protein